MALAAGFGLDLERCDPLVFEALTELLEERGREQKQQQQMQDLKSRLGK